MSNRKKVAYASVYRVLMTPKDGDIGLFEQTLGVRLSSGSIKGVHIMNDLAQCALGGAPGHGGDFLCKVIRPDADASERTGEADMRRDKRFAADFNRAFPQDLGPRRVRALRGAVRLVANFDDGLYVAGTSMASGLATHWTLLGFEGFRRFKVGQYLLHAIGPRGGDRLRALFRTSDDPVSRALRPLLLEAPLEDKGAPTRMPSASQFDVSLGEGLTTLLDQGLTKPVTLRLVALAGSLGVALKVVGAGREGGRPIVLALPSEHDGPTTPLREEAVISLQAGFEALYDLLATRLSSHPASADLLSQRAKGGGREIEVTGGLPLETVAAEIINAARKEKIKDVDERGEPAAEKEQVIYWPEKFVHALGRRSGFVLPRGNKAGWGKRLVLTPEHVEALVLMVVPRGERMMWREFWSRVRDRLGVIIGANASADAVALRQAGVPHINVQQLAASAEVILAQAVRRGVARRLPDSGAEVGGALS